MKKHRRIIVGVLFLALVFVAFVGFRSVFKTSEVAEVSKNETIAPTTDGKQCDDPDEMSSYYGAGVEYNSSGTQATISVNNGTFKATSVSAVNDDGNSVSVGSLITSNPLSMGNLSENNPMKISIASGADGTVTIHFVVAESDEKCLAYDSASADDSGQKVGTYEMDVELQLNPIKPERGQVDNTNYNGICSVFRTGEGYSNYKSVFDGAGVSKSDIEQYNYAVANADQKTTYDSIMSYCVTPGQVSFNYTEEQTASLIAAAIRIAKTQKVVGDGSSTPGVGEDFMAAFNDAKQKAIAAGNDYSDKVDDGSLPDEVIGLKCDWKLKKTESDYYVNKDYYYAKEEEVENVTYDYHYTSGEVGHSDGGNCTRTCEESVIVEYGPPVASKAGLCFEYKVRVTSRVVCNSGLKLQPPTPPAICTPTPFCNRIPGKTHQGGPNEDFATCIQECDGGQYSEACSSKCYEEVYEDEASYDPLTIHDENIVTVKPVSAFPGYSGRYEWSGNSIVWKGNGTTYGRWYQENEAWRTENEHDYSGYVGNGGRHKYLPDSNGFKRQNFYNSLCQDPCYWSGCSKQSYLNDEDAAQDTINNLEKYNQAIATCTAAASCTTKTAHFTISVNYTDGKGVSQTKAFPLESSGVSDATLPSHGEGTVPSPGGTEIFIPELTINPEQNQDGYAGCYDDASAKNWYQAAWSFPGTWINNKTGAIVYKKPSNENAWKYKEDKFCIPLDAQSVNTKWWEWSELDNKSCYSESQIESEVNNNQNIKATTTDFGYFGWNFNISCFYALRNEECVPDESGCCSTPVCEDPPCDDDETTVSTRDYAFRIVNLSNLFPESDKTTSENASKISSAGRQPGYNWSMQMTDDDASILTSLQQKNPDYKINPLSLIDTIQNRGNSIYTDKYKDYEITLDTNTLKEVREFNSGKSSYTDYGGSTGIYHGVTSYRSDLLDDLGGNVKTIMSRNQMLGVNNVGEGE